MSTKAVVITEERHFVDCPSCGKHRFGIPTKDFEERLYFCIECGKGLKFKREKGEVWTEEDAQSEQRTLVFLRYEDMLLVVEGVVFNGELDEEEAHYNMHLCPTTYFKTALAVVDLRDRDTDPHGMFEYITTVVVDHAQYKVFDEEEIELEELEKLTGLQFEEF